MSALGVPLLLKPLIRAAYAGQLPPGSKKLPNNGLVSDLGDFVLQACALWLLGSQKEAREQLEMAHKVWKG